MWGFLHTSPEYGMKRLLSAGIGDCYQLSHVFRLGEASDKHNPEFTMAEWYRIGMSFEPFIEETLDFLRLFLGDLPSSFLSYRDALKKYAGIDYVYASINEILDCAQKYELNLTPEVQRSDKATLLQILLGCLVEPHLGKDELLVLYDYPASEAALAKTKQKDDELVAERFEVYFRGIELCNGYHELTDAKEQRNRLLEDEQTRLAMGKPPLVMDENFLRALEEGLPPCCGVAVGFDRLLMICLNKTTIDEIIPFSWKDS